MPDPESGESTDSPEELEPDVADSEPSIDPEADPPDPLAQVTEERDELRSTLQRVQADFENFRKRIMRDQATQTERAHQGLVAQLLPVLDSLELAILNIPSGDMGEPGEKLKKGVELVYADLLSVLEKEGLTRVEALGKPFDPEEHEAVLRDDGEGDPIVTEVMRAGYRHKGRVIRPAMVRVGPPPA